MPRVTAVVDAHVHIHACYDADHFFDSAFANLSLAILDGSAPAAHPFFLFFTESAGDDYFAALRAIAAGESATGEPAAAHSPHRLKLHRWSVSLTDEAESLVAHEGERFLHLIGGRQVACREGLEVLMLATTAKFKDRRPIRDVLAEAVSLNLPHVIPWGAGKWFFKRAKLLTAILQDHKSALFFLGDEGGRPGFWPYPHHFREGAALGVRDLPGTDPLPFAHDVDKVGKMGFRLEMDMDPRRPCESILRALSDRNRKFERFARLEPPLRFVRNQVAMQLRKRQSA